MRRPLHALGRITSLPARRTLASAILKKHRPLPPARSHVPRRPRGQGKPILPSDRTAAPSHVAKAASERAAIDYVCPARQLKSFANVTSHCLRAYHGAAHVSESLRRLVSSAQRHVRCSKSLPPTLRLVSYQVSARRRSRIKNEKHLTAMKPRSACSRVSIGSPSPACVGAILGGRSRIP